VETPSQEMIKLNLDKTNPQVHLFFGEDGGHGYESY
jgi:hypothetical protein